MAQSLLRLQVYPHVVWSDAEQAGDGFVAGRDPLLHTILTLLYIHMCRARAAGGGASMGDSMHKREENSVRVTNLSEDTREDDLRVRIPATD